MADASPQRRSHWPIAILSSASAAINLFLPLVLVRVLTPSDIGLFKQFFLYLSIMPAFALSSGIMSGLSFWAGQPREQKVEIQSSGFLILIVGVILSLLCLAASAPLGRVLRWDLSCALFFSAAIVASIASTFFEEAAIATGRIWAGAFFNAGFEVARAASILVSVYISPSVESVFIAHLAVSLLKTASGYIYAWYLGLVRFVLKPEAVKAVLNYSLPVSVAWVFGVFVSSADQLILSRTITPIDFAFYSIGCLSLAPLFILEHSITRVLIPQMAEAFAQKNLDRALALYRDAVENLALLLIPATTGLVIFAQPIIELLFTPTYSAASDYLRVFAVSYLFLIIPYDSVPRARGQATWILKTFMAFSAISVALAVLLIPPFGPWGAMASFLCAGGGMRVFAVWYIKRDTKSQITRFLPVSSIALFSLLSGILALLSVLAASLFSTQRLWFLICGPMFGVIYIFFAVPVASRDQRRRKQKLHVLMVSQGLTLGGIERMILSLSRALQTRGKFRVSVLAYDQDPQHRGVTLLPEFEKENIPVEVFKKPARFSPEVSLKLVCYIFKHDVDILHCHDLGGLIYGSIAKVCSLWRVRLVMTQHSFIHLQDIPKTSVYERVFTRFADRLVVVSSDVQEVYGTLGLKNLKLDVIENGIDSSVRPPLSHEARTSVRELLFETVVSSTESQRLRSLSDTLWILYMARLYPKKGQEHAIALWNLLTPEIRGQCALVFVGPESLEGQEKLLQGIIAKSEMPERIVVLGGSSAPERWLHACDVFLSCSEYEGMPLGPLEAVVNAVPTILSDIPGHQFLSEYAVLFPLIAPEQGARRLSNTVAQLDQDGSFLFEQAEERTKQLRERYSLEDMTRRYEAIYTELD